ncbi:MULTISPECIES: outer membrane beta-barrel protein [unclassified Leptolyngbya]|uniref:outer membrane beta-barrel protein n=1 Tax=unclassified Leptolyngbya TaxID=2650499 RepID=UPI001684EE50|nr:MULTISPECIES: outer membrane beta-barrel protein [unclassified Leptolyngbya]MBD1912310.1 outer membrane beta-barrel protein [Leptolyngbya sp. FACHB-8]MBD2158054.1 outer membrane beta-barrel protein [Leptolyngbya sp. FACHB-16]
MKNVLKSLAVGSVMTAAIAAPMLLSAGPASAQPFVGGMSGSYLGGGISAGVTEDGTFGGNVQGRFDVPVAPVSVRGAALFSDDGVALMPLVTYDLPVAPRTNLYVGGGYSFVTEEGGDTPLGNQNAPVVMAGAETAVTRNVVVYGDAKVGIDAYQDSNDAAISLQLGAAYRF